MVEKKEKIPLSVVKKFPYKTLNRMINKLRAFLKKDKVMQDLFKEYSVDLEEIDFIPMRFGTIDVSAKTDHAIIIFNYKLLTDGDFFKDYAYAVHEITHFLQQTTGNKPTKSSDDGEYLENPYEKEGFANQLEYMAEQFGKNEAEKYVDDLLDYHDIDNKSKRDELESSLLKKV